MAYTASFGYQWNIHAKTQLDSYSGLTISRDRLFATTGWPEQMTGVRIMEAGSGAGRFTEVLLLTGADVWSFDDSSAVEANRANNGHQPNLHLFRANINDVDLPPFDKVLCLGVIQHTPDPATTFRSLARHVRPGGELVIDIYAKRLTAVLHWKYLLRPITKRMRKETLYRMVSCAVPVLLPLAIAARRIGGRIGARLVPVVEHSHLGLTYNEHLQWSFLDTFDALSPKHDHPQTEATVRGWFKAAGFVDIDVRPGQNGIVGKGRRPATTASA